MVLLVKIQRIEEHGRLAQYNRKFTEKMECFEDTRLKPEIDISQSTLYKLEFENKDNKVVKHTLNPDAEKYVPTTNVGSMRKAKDTELNRTVGISMEEEKDM